MTKTETFPLYMFVRSFEKKNEGLNFGLEKLYQSMDCLPHNPILNCQSCNKYW